MSEVNFKNYDVSVVLTLFNSRKYYMDAVNSVLKQTFPNWELIIVDDGSSDEIEIDLFPLLKANDNFKYLRHSNRKHPLSLNSGIAVSSGKYITFLDSDDEYLPVHLEERVNLFSENASIDLISSPALLVGEQKNFYVPDVKDISRMIHIDECIIGGTLFGKREVFNELGGFRNIYSHDSDFYERANERFNVFGFDSRTYVYKRNNPESVTNLMMKDIDEYK